MKLKFYNDGGCELQEIEIPKSKFEAVFNGEVIIYEGDRIEVVELSEEEEQQTPDLR